MTLLGFALILTALWRFLLATLLGNNTKPMHAGVIYGLNTKNQQGVLLTLPAGGPFRITRLGGWLDGSNSAPQARLCLWADGGTLLRQSASFALTSRPAEHGEWAKHEYDLTSTIDLAGGSKVYVGWSRDPSGAHQFGVYSGGTRLDDTATGSWPDDLVGFVSETNTISAWLYYEAANQAPTKPTNLSPSGTIHTGRTITYGWQHNDPDGGKPAGHHWRLFLTDGTLIHEDYDSTNNTTRTTTLPAGYNADREYDFDVRTKDAAGLWGPFSDKQRFRPNTPPSATTPNVPATNTLTPALSGGFSEPDPGGTFAAVQYRVYSWNGSAWELIYTSGELTGVGVISGATWGDTYAGPALGWGNTYAYDQRTRDEWGAWSPYGSKASWTPIQPTGPTLTSPSFTDKNDDDTPTVTATYAEAFNRTEYQIYADDGVTLVHNLGSDHASATSYSESTPALTHGTWYRIRSRVRVTATLVFTEWSQQQRFYINADPLAPEVFQAIDSLTGLPAITNAAGVLVTPDNDPTLIFDFDDVDQVAYGDAPSIRRIEIRRKSDQVALTGYPREDTAVADTTPTDHVLTTLLPIDDEHEVRVGFRDDAGWPLSPNWAWSAWKTIKHSVPPTLGLTAPSAGATIADSTPLLDWTFAGSGGKAQQKYRVRIYDRGLTFAAVAISSSSVANPTVITTAVAHGLVSGDRVTIAGHTGSTPAIDGVHIVTVLSATTFSIPVNVTVAGTGGTVDRTPEEVLVHDSGERISADTSYLVPFGNLADDHDYRWSVEAWDTDGLSKVLT